MNSNLKIVLPLVLIVAVIFGVTLISVNVGDNPTDGEPTVNPNKISGPPLNFLYTQIGYNPTAEQFEARTFDAFHEQSSTVLVSFWFTNTHSVPVAVEGLGRGCPACSQARIGYIEEANLDDSIKLAAIGSFPFSPFSAVNLLPTVAATKLSTSMKWLPDFDFDKGGSVVTIPAAKEGKPVVGVFQMAVIIKMVGPSDKRYINLRLTAQGGQPAVLTFFPNLVGVQPFEMLENAIRVPPMNEGAESRTYQLYALSATRKLPSAYGSELPLNAPEVTVVPADPFIQVGAVTPLTEEELNQARYTLIAAKKLTTIRSGYSIKVTVHRQRPGQTPAEPDIGQFSRDLSIRSPGTGDYTPVVNISGVHQGLVSLNDGSAIDLKDFPGTIGTTRTVSLISDTPGIQLAIVAEENRPGILSAKLSAPRDEGGRRYWDLTVTVPAGSMTKPLPPESCIALKATLPSGDRKIRIPVKGNGFAR